MLNTCSIQHLYKIVADNLKCNTGTSDFALDTIKCNTCQKLRHYLCTKVYLLASFMSDVAHCWYSDHYSFELAIMYTNDDQFVPMNAISDTSTNFDFYHIYIIYIIILLYNI